MGWITAIVASGPAHKAMGLFLATATLALFLLNLRRAGGTHWATGRASFKYGENP